MDGESDGMFVGAADGSTDGASVASFRLKRPRPRREVEPSALRLSDVKSSARTAATRTSKQQHNPETISFFRLLSLGLMNAVGDFLGFWLVKGGGVADAVSWFCDPISLEEAVSTASTGSTGSSACFESTLFVMLERRSKIEEYERMNRLTTSEPLDTTAVEWSF